MGTHQSIEALIEAIKKNDLHEGSSLLKGELDLRVTDDLGRSPLMIAVLYNRFWFVAELLQKGYSPDQKDITELSPLIAAAARGFDNIFELLLVHSSAIDGVNRFGGTALLPSSEKGYLRTVQLGIAGKVPINHQNRLGWSALLEAVILGNGGYLYQEIVSELVSNGADITQRDFDNKTSLDYAKALQQTEVLAILERSYADDYDDIRGLIRNNHLNQSLCLIMSQPSSLQKLFFLGYIYELLEKFEESHFYYQEGLGKDPQFAFYLANLERKAGNRQETLAYFDLGAAHQQDFFFCYHKSNYLRDTGHHKEAIEEMTHLLQLSPERVDFMFHKANSLRSLGRDQEAKDIMLVATNLSPDNLLFAEHVQQSNALLQEKGENHHGAE